MHITAAGQDGSQRQIWSVTMVNDTYDNIKMQWLNIRFISFKAVIYIAVKIRPQRLWVCVFKSVNILENVLEPQILLLIAKI